MDWLSEKPDTLFLGQAVDYAGTAITNTLKDVDKNKLLEMPVNEDMQMGISLGMSLNVLCLFLFILDGIFYY